MTNQGARRKGGSLPRIPMNGGDSSVCEEKMDLRNVRKDRLQVNNQTATHKKT